MPSRRVLPALALSIASLLPSACVGAPDDADAETAASTAEYPVEISSCGVTTTVDAPPTSAVTLNQGATEVVLALGAADQLVGTAYLDDAVPDRWQAAYESVPVLSEQYPDHETVMAAEPDFVYASYLSAFDSEAAGDRATLHELGAATYVSPFGCGTGASTRDITFDTVWQEIADVATVFGVPERADRLREEQARQLDALRREAAGEGIEVFWFDSGVKTAFAGAGDGGPQLVLDAIGATNVFADVEGGWADVSWEDVVVADPEVIVLADAAWSTAEDKIALLQRDEVLSQLDAVRHERFVTIPFSESTPGVRLVEGATSVAEQIRALGLR
ncbi:ABC transporter substrate-binding protein [Saccharomonospora azurea]|uniref:ABC transporter substrate-binding protein n=1 Tax=Saccharomonospora azurea TaxID=40988 RepID=UPI003D929C61